MKIHNQKRFDIFQIQKEIDQSKGLSRGSYNRLI